MARRFRINFNSDDGTAARLFQEPDLGADSRALNGVIADFCIVLPRAGESEDWIFAEIWTVAKEDEGWLPSWAVGEALPDPVPDAISARGMTMAAARNEDRMRSSGDRTVSAEYLIALLLIENDLQDRDSGFGAETELELRAERPGDAPGAYGISTEDWEAFVQDEGASIGWVGASIRLLSLPQMRAAAWITRRDWTEFANAMAPEAADDVVVRKLDNFMSWLIGVPAAVEIARRELAGEAMDTSIDQLLDSATAEVRMQRYPQFLTDGGAPATAQVFRDRVEAVLDRALALGRRALDAYLPGFAVNLTPLADKWVAEAEDELKAWIEGGWTEGADPGRSRALGYFAATPETQAGAKAGEPDEITDWCGAFLATVMQRAGAPVPKLAAASRSWAGWGDISLPAAWGGDVPKGAVVVMAGSRNTNRIGHVCLFMGWSGEGRFNALGGNQNDRVSMDTAADARRIVDIRFVSDKTAPASDDVETLARTLWGEIRAGNEEQRRRVADVVLNRFLTGYRSNGSIASVCLSPFQFSCWNPGTDARRRIDQLPSTDPELQKLAKLADVSIAERLSGAPPADARLKDVRHYHTSVTTASWSRGVEPVFDDGLHKFYRGIP